VRFLLGVLVELIPTESAENDEFAFETNKSGIKLENLGKDTTVVLFQSSQERFGLTLLSEGRGRSGLCYDGRAASRENHALLQ
jgi:hypothetical protein